MEKVIPEIIHESQTGYVKGRYIGENIRTISDKNAKYCGFGGVPRL